MINVQDILKKTWTIETSAGTDLAPGEKLVFANGRIERWTKRSWAAAYTVGNGEITGIVGDKTFKIQCQPDGSLVCTLVSAVRNTNAPLEESSPLRRGVQALPTELICPPGQTNTPNSCWRDATATFVAREGETGEVPPGGHIIKNPPPTGSPQLPIPVAVQEAPLPRRVTGIR